MRVAAVQHDIVWGDRKANFDRLAPRIAEAAHAGADLVALSETFSTGFGFGMAGFTTEPVGGPSSAFLSSQAEAHRCWVAGSCPEVQDDDAERRPANTLVLAGPDGTQYRYRKIHPFSFSGEDRVIRPGSELLTITVRGVRLTPLICYDLRFVPEWWATAADTDVYLVVANWPAARREHWSTLLRARAIENQAYVVGVNRVGNDGAGMAHAGDTAVFDPFGNVLVAASEAETTVVADVDAATVSEIRERFPFMADRVFSDDVTRAVDADQA